MRALDVNAGERRSLGASEDEAVKGFTVRVEVRVVRADVLVADLKVLGFVGCKIGWRAVKVGV
jgi:hypothetical protein